MEDRLADNDHSQNPYQDEPLMLSAIGRAGGQRSPRTSESPPRNRRRASKESRRTKAHHPLVSQPTEPPFPDAGWPSLRDAHGEPPNRQKQPKDERTTTASDRKETRRTRERVDERNDADEKTICKYLPVSLDSVLGPPVSGPDDTFTPPEWLLEAVHSVAVSPCQPPTPPPVKFSTTSEDLTTNARILRAHNFDLTPLINSAKGTTMDPAAEFRPVNHLARIYHRHPNFSFVSNMVTHGMGYTVLRELTEDERVRELEANLERGNHKSASENLEHLSRLLARDVKFGFALPVPTATVRSIKGAMVQPAGLANQFALQPDGSRARKQRLTHDLSFSATIPDASINSRIDMTAYPEMIYGWCLLRVIHFVAALRLENPDVPILIAKYDFSDAYRRVAHTATAAAQTILALGDVAYIMLRLAFGGSPNPPAWCAFSEMVTDLANEIPLCANWDPQAVHSPAQPSNPEPLLEDTPTKFAAAEPMAVKVPTTTSAKADCFIDDIIHVLLATPDNIARRAPSVPLAVHVSNRPHQGDREPMPRRENISVPKLAAEGTPAETQTVLGWELATRAMVVRLPQDKFIAWTVDVAEIIRNKRSTFGDLESCIGRLNHVAFLIPLSRHFISRLQRRLSPRRTKQQHVTLNVEELEDLKLWLKFLHWGRQGISMNLITHRRPSTIGLSDSCPYGLGGFLWTGRAWRLRIPESSIIYGDHVANNALEMLGMVITIWLAVLDNPRPHRCILSLGDNTSAIGWLFHSSFSDGTSVYERVVPLMARKVTTILLEARQTLFSQHLPGAINTVADLLSFTTHSQGLQHLSPAHRNTLLRHAHSANHGIFHASAGEAAFESKDRTWRRWTGFCRATGIDNPLLDHLSDGARELVIRSFFSCLRTAVWSESGDLSSVHQKRVSATTVRNAASNLAAAFRIRFRASPVHLPHGTQLLPSLRALFKAFDNLDPPQQRQKAITPRFLRALYKLGANQEIRPNAYDHSVDLIIGAFFFAMCSCEYCIPTKPGRTKTLLLRHLSFRDKNRKLLPLDLPDLDRVAMFVTVTFEDQKSGVKMDSRSQKRTADPILCPCLRLGRAVMRVVQTIPHWSTHTLLCSIQTEQSTSHITNKFTKRLLRHACTLYGGHDTFGFHPHEIGNQSIRSGAAMALFLKDHSTAKIMILGRWSSDAFLVYIRPQVLEWANNMSTDMVSFDSFLDVGLFDQAASDEPRTRRRTHTLNGSGVTIPAQAFNLHH